MDRRSLWVFTCCLALVFLSAFAGSTSAQVSCSGVPAFASCTAYANGTSVTYNGSKYTTIAPIPNNRDCPPSSPYNPSNDNWWTNNGSCTTTATPTATSRPIATATTTRATATATTGRATATATATATRTPTATATSGGSGCSGVAAFQSCTAYATGAKVSFNSTLYHAIAPIPANRDCPPSSPYDPTTDNYWQNDGACTSATATPSGPTPTTVPAGTKYSAPYIDVSPGSGSAIMQLASNGSGNKHYSLAFILGAGCQAAWFGTFPLNTTEAAGIGTRISELKAAGGNVIISFGGAAAPELADVCSSASALQAQYQAVVNMYHPMACDFDIEDFSPTAIDIRNQALAAGIGCEIHYTLGVLQSGFTASQTQVLTNAKSHGVNVALVNIMAMDYGGAVGDMGAAAISAAQASRSWLNANGFSGTKLGITPMIGQNDQGGEIFTLANASSLASWANGNNVTELAFWSVGRDNGGCAGSGAASPSCSGVSQSSFQFSSIFHGFGN
jgi:hypothetical protein